MAWTTPKTFSDVVLTSTELNVHIRDNLVVLRAGGVAIGSQGANEILFASSATQLARSSLFTFDGSVLTVGGSGTHTFGAGGAGATNTGIELDGSSASGRGSSITFSRNSVGQAFIGTESGLFANNSNALAVYGASSDGVWIVTDHASGTIRFSAGGAGVDGTMHASGGFSWGDATDPGATNFRVAGTITTTTVNAGTSLSVAAGVAVIDATGFKMGVWPTTATAANTHVADGNYIRLVTSLKSAKRDIASIDAFDALRVVRRLRGVRYRSRVDDDQRLWPGFVAEDVEAVTPDLVMYNERGALQSVAYDRIPVYLVGAFHALEVRVKELAARR